MQETPDEMTQLQTLLDRSVEKAGNFLRESFEIPQKSLSAQQLVMYLQGIHTVAFATVTSKGEPRVAPIGALFYRGHFAIPTVATAARTKQVQRNPAISLTYFAGNDLAIIVHGTASVLGSDHPDFAVIEELQFANTGSRVNEWGKGIFLRVNADVFYTYARDPIKYAE